MGTTTTTTTPKEREGEFYGENIQRVFKRDFVAVSKTLMKLIKLCCKV